MLADQMISRIEFMHNRKFLHRDIKPGNFCLGRNENAHKIFLLDLGLAQRYIQRDGCRSYYERKKKITGTARYASINTHLGIDQGRNLTI